MKNKIVMVVFLIVVLLLIIIGIFVIGNMKKNSDECDDIPQDYIVAFHGGVGEQTFQTYIYKIDNGRDNYGFKYINAVSTTKYYGSFDWVRKITSKGEFDWSDEAFDIARENGAYSYVTFPGDRKSYDIEEFRKEFVTN